MKNTDLEINDLEYEVEIERILSDRYGFKKDTVRRNYDEVIQSMGLSGNAKSDYQALQSSIKEVEARAEKIAKIQNMGPVERRARTIVASASRLAASMGRGSSDIITKILTTGELNKFNESEEDRKARDLQKEKNLEFGGKVSRFFRDVKESSGEVYGEDAQFRQTFEGKLFEGGTQLVGQMGTLGFGLIPQMYDEAVSDAESYQGVPYEEMSPDMQSRVDATAGTYAIIGAALERIGLGGITKKLLGKNTSTALMRLLNVGSAAATEGITEAAQGQTLDILARAIQEDGREIWNTETLMQRLEEFAIGGILGGAARGSIESGDVLYNKFLDPEKAATKADIKAIEDKSDNEVAAAVVEKTGDVEKAELAVAAKNGDEQARQEYVESHYYQEGEEPSFELEAGLTKEEIEVGLPDLSNDTSALPEGFYLEQERELDDAVRLSALDEAQDWFESIQGDDQSIERNDEKLMPFLNKVNDLAIQYGWNQTEKDAYINEVLEAAGSNLGRDLSEMVDKLTVMGESTVEFINGVANYKSKLYKGATVFDLVEEEVEGYAERYLQEGSATYQEFIEWKQSIEQEAGEQTHSNTDRGVIEWLSSQGQAWYLKNMQDQEALGRAPTSFIEFIQRFIEKLKAVFRDAGLLRKLDEEGKLNQDLRTFLDRALGFDEAYLEERMRQEELQQIEPIGEELMDVVKEIGGVPRPDSDPAYRGELETYFESIGKKWKSLKKDGGTLDGLAEALRERGFENMQTPDDVLQALDASARGEKIYSNTFGQMQGGTYSIGFEDDGIDPKEFARERTPEEEALAQKLRELRNFDLTEKERKKLQEEAKVLQVKAVESRKRQRLQQSASKKVAAEIEKRVKQIKAMAKNRDNLEKAIKELEKLLSKLPKEVKARFSGYGQLASRKTVQGQERYFEQATNRIDAIVDRIRFKENRDQLLKIVSTYYTDYGPNRRKLRARVGEKAFDELYFAASLVRNGDAPRPKTIEPERAEMLRNVFGGVLVEGKSGNPVRIADAAKLAEDIVKSGRNEMDEWNEARKARNETRNNEAIDTILKGEKLKTEQQIQNDRRDRSKFKLTYDTAMALFFHPLNGLQQMMNLLDGKKGGFLEKEFAEDAFKSEQKEMSMNKENVDRTKADLLKIFDGDAKKQAQWFQNASERIDTGISWVSESGLAKEELTRLEMIDVLAQWGDPTLRNTFYLMKVTDEQIEKIKELATPYGVRLAQYVRDRYAEIGVDIQAKFKETEGYAMDLVEGYGGRVYRAGVKIDPDDTMFGFGGDGSRATVKSASMKERVDSVKPIVFSDAMAKFEKHMREANHYISHAALAKKFFATFRSRQSEVRKAIKQRYGDEMLSELDSLIDDMIRGRLKSENQIYRILNGFRANVTKASLAIKPAVAIKQLTSWPAFSEEIGFKEYGKAFSEFSKDPMRWMKAVYDTEYVKNRLSSSFYADIQDQIRSHSQILGKTSIMDVMMFNVKAGDIGAVIFGGAPVYLHAYKKARNSGMSEADARVEAERVFGMASERAQQSSAMSSRGAYLRDNSWTRSWFMYMTSPIQYQRNINVALYNHVQALVDQHKGNKADVKGTRKQLLRALLIFHVMLPQIFQAVASGFLAFIDDDDVRELFWKRQAQTLLYGNLNILPIAGQLIEGIGKMVVGNKKEIFDSSGSPLLDLMQETKDSTMRAFEDGDSEDWMRLGEDASKFFGIPMETGFTYMEAIEDVYNNDTDHPILRLLGWSEWALGERQ